MLDAIVVGGGPAGLAAATWLGRYRRRTLVLDRGEHRNRWVEQAHGYLGSDPVHPADLLERARRDLRAYPDVTLTAGTALRSRRDGDDCFTVETEEGDVHRARRLVLATGVRDEFPQVDNFFEHYGASVFHCPTCDGFEAHDCDVVAFGWSEQVVGFALTLLGWARTVTVVTDGRRFEGDRRDRERLAACGVRLVEGDAVELLGRRGALEGVRLRDGSVLRCELAFFSIAHRQNDVLVDELGCERDGEGCVAVDEHGATSVPGVYAAGDLTPGIQLVQVAAAKGTVAGVACAMSLRGEGGVPEGWHGEIRGYSGPMTQHDDAAQPGAERLEELRDEIEDVRERVDPDDQQRFYESGEVDEREGVEDDAIAPPG